MTPAAWISIGVGGALVVAFVAWWFWPARGCDHSCREPHYQADHTDPTKRWIHGVLALYRGDVGDPAYWDPACVERQAAGWSLTKRADLDDLLARYRDGEINPAFDKVRLIWLARVGRGKGWLSDVDSWRWCAAAADALRQRYDSWAALFQDVDQGRVAWYEGQVPPAERQRGHDHYRFAASEVLQQIPFR